MKFLVSVLLISAVVSAGCHSNSTTAPTTTTTTPSVTTNVFTGTLDPLASAFYNFNVVQSETATIALGSLTVGNMVISAPMSLGLGTLASDALSCNPTQSVTATPGLQTQITASLLTGTYCVRIADTGSLAQTTNFAVRINQNVGTAPPGTPATENFATLLYPGGTDSKYFAVNQSGTINVMLTGVTPPSPVAVGLGIADSSDVVCSLNMLQTAGAGQQLAFSAAVDPGIYCVSIADTGTLTDRVRFTATVDHP
jgi:hypothetical protein